LNSNGWVHLFPEAKVNPEHWNLLPFRWGVGHLIQNSNQKPIVLPFYHRGLANVRPEKYKYGLKVGKEVSVLFGDIIDFDHLEFQGDVKSQRIEMTKYLQNTMLTLKQKIENN
jgi:monolysocardiolipin acyltransferase